jgi:hypothetical protein
MIFTASSKSTNVRFLRAPLVALASALAGCAMPELALQRAECGAGLELVCTAFGPARSCDCVPRAQVDRFLTTFGEPAWLGEIR